MLRVSRSRARTLSATLFTAVRLFPGGDWKLFSLPLLKPPGVQAARVRLLAFAAPIPALPAVASPPPVTAEVYFDSLFFGTLRPSAGSSPHESHKSAGRNSPARKEGSPRLAKATAGETPERGYPSGREAGRNGEGQ